MDEPEEHHQVQATYEHQGGDEEGSGAFGKTEEVERGEQDQQGQAEGDGGRCQGREGRGQGGDAGGDGHGHGEHVVNDQRGTRQETGNLAEVSFANRVGAAAVGVGGDDLAVREDQDG